MGDRIKSLLIYLGDVGGEVCVQDLEKLQQCTVGQVLRNTAERQAAVVQISQQQGRQVGGKLPRTRINMMVVSSWK